MMVLEKGSEHHSVQTIIQTKTIMFVSGEAICAVVNRKCPPAVGLIEVRGSVIRTFGSPGTVSVWSKVYISCHQWFIEYNYHCHFKII